MSCSSVYVDPKWYLVADTTAGDYGCDNESGHNSYENTFETCTSYGESNGCAYVALHEDGYCACFTDCDFAREPSTYSSLPQVYAYSVLCDEDEYVSSKTCLACAAGSKHVLTYTAYDVVALGSNTACDGMCFVHSVPNDQRFCFSSA